MTLELKGSVTATVRNYGSKADSRNDGKTAQVGIDIRLNEEQATALGGKVFGRACFSDYVGKSGAITASSKTLAGENVVKVEHSMVIAEYPIVAKPKVTDVQILEGDRAVVLSLRLEIPFSAAKLRRLLDDACGDDIEIEFKGAAQPEIPGTDGEDARHGFDKAKANGNGAEHEEEPTDTVDADGNEITTAGHPAPMFDDDGDEVEASA